MQKPFKTALSKRHRLCRYASHGPRAGPLPRVFFPRRAQRIPNVQVCNDELPRIEAIQRMLLSALLSFHLVPFQQRQLHHRIASYAHLLRLKILAVSESRLESYLGFPLRPTSCHCIAQPLPLPHRREYDHLHNQHGQVRRYQPQLAHGPALAYEIDQEAAVQIAARGFTCGRGSEDEMQEQARQVGEDDLQNVGAPPWRRRKGQRLGREEEPVRKDTQEEPKEGIATLVSLRAEGREPVGDEYRYVRE